MIVMGAAMIDSAAWRVFPLILMEGRHFIYTQLYISDIECTEKWVGNV